MKEKWLDINDYDGLYQISNLGRVKSFKQNKKGKIRKTTISRCGYYMVILTKNRKQKNKTIHRLVALHFIKNTNKEETVNHKNGIKGDNIYTNLEWCSLADNLRHARKTGLNVAPKGESHHMSRLTTKDVIEIKLMLKNRITHQNIADKFKVSRAHITDINSGRRWKHITT